MNPDPAAGRQALRNAQSALQRGDKYAARRWAEQAVALAPQMEESWLILAAVASPRASLAYLQRALEVNPQSERARKGMAWAIERLGEEPPKHTALEPPKTAALNILKGSAASASIADTAPRRAVQSKGVAPKPAPDSSPPTTPSLLDRVTSAAPVSPPAAGASSVLPEKRSRKSLAIWPVLATLVCITVVWAVWPGNASPVLAFLRENIPNPTPTILGAPVDLPKPTYTPTFTPIHTPSPTFTPLPTFTATLTPSPTEPPSPTPLPTDTPWPSDTPGPSDTTVLTDTPAPSPGGPSPTQPYTDTGGVHWIEVNLSQQMLYAHEGDLIVASFLVSTGTAQYPTVTGDFYIYMKFLFADMAGPGYYLPDVPYTMYFYKGYAIHGTYWHNNFGTPMSHGCVNMRIDEAGWVYYWAPLGTLVNVHY